MELNIYINLFKHKICTNSRISVIFRVRSAKAVKITDASLLKRLGVLCGFVGVFLLVRTLVAPPVVIVGRTADNLKAFLCKTDWWDHTFTSSLYTFLFIFLSIYKISFCLSLPLSPFGSFPFSYILLNLNRRKIERRKQFI